MRLVCAALLMLSSVTVAEAKRQHTMSEIIRDCNAGVQAACDAWESIGDAIDAEPTAKKYHVEAQPLQHDRRFYEKQYADLNDRCRGGSGDDPATLKACDEREALAAHMRKQGLCISPRTMSFMRCR